MGVKQAVGWWLCTFSLATALRHVPWCLSHLPCMHIPCCHFLKLRWSKETPPSIINTHSYTFRCMCAHTHTHCTCTATNTLCLKNVPCTVKTEWVRIPLKHKDVYTLHPSLVSTINKLLRWPTKTKGVVSNTHTHTHTFIFLLSSHWKNIPGGCCWCAGYILSSYLSTMS